jgi:hypothetical protein
LGQDMLVAVPFVDSGCVCVVLRAMVILIVPSETGVASFWFAKILRVTEAEAHLIQLEPVAGEANAYRANMRSVWAELIRAVSTLSMAVTTSAPASIRCEQAWLTSSGCWNEPVPITHARTFFCNYFVFGVKVSSWPLCDRRCATCNVLRATWVASRERFFVRFFFLFHQLRCLLLLLRDAEDSAYVRR